MRDLIWTIIIIWVVYKIVDIFRSVRVVKKTFVYNNQSQQNNEYKKPEGSVTVESKTAQNGKTPKANATDGDYIDFEEIK